MKVKPYLIAIIFFPFMSCGQNIENNDKLLNNLSIQNSENEIVIINETGKNIFERIPVPKGFERVSVDSLSFGYYLRNLPLKPHGSLVKYYNGDIKNKDNVYIAVVDQAISRNNLQQCADAVMRLRGEYLYWKKDYKNLHFNFTNGFNCEFSKWIEGERLRITGDKASWVKKTQPSASYSTFLEFMETVFTYAGSFSLSKEMMQVSYIEMQIGDVLIRGGFPGHTVIIVDMAVNKNNTKIFLLAQSYMPAQETQILVNPVNEKLSPWYELDSLQDPIETPEFLFKTTELMRFK